MYKKSERVLPFYSLIEKNPQTLICHLDVFKRIWSSFLFAHFCCLDFCLLSVNSIYSLKKYTTRLVFTKCTVTLCTYRQ